MLDFYNMNSSPANSPRFSVTGRIDRPVAEVFEAVADPDQLSQYFTTGGAKGRLTTGTTVTWDFADFPWGVPGRGDRGRAAGAHRAAVGCLAARGQPDRLDHGDDDVRPTDDGRTLVTITEEGWSDNDEGRSASYGNCEGWTGMLCASKAWLEHGINLRDGFYK